MAARPFFIVNPMSSGGRTGERWERRIRPLVTARFGAGARWAATRSAGQASALAEGAARDGADLVVAVGGDGTLHEVVNGLMAIDGGQRPALGLIPTGTGCDFARGVGVPRDPARAVSLLAESAPTAADVCEVICAAPSSGDGTARRPPRRFSINTCGCGIGGRVVASVNEGSGPRHGPVAFLLASLRAVSVYRPRDVVVAIDDGPPFPLRLLALFVCNGEYCGGGMRPGRGARIDDGLLRVLEVSAMHPARMVANLHRLYTGRVEGIRGVRAYDARRVEVTGPADVLVDADGEQPGTLPARFVVHPGALRVVRGAGPGAG